MGDLKSLTVSNLEHNDSQNLFKKLQNSGQSKFSIFVPIAAGGLSVVSNKIHSVST